ncbi:peroxiredoxin [soil metagenome]
MIKVGSRVPPLRLARLCHGLPEAVDTERYLAARRSIIVGVPGAFTPVCTAEHVPSFIAQADALARSGFSRITCVVGNDPWVTAQWAEMLDPAGRIDFLSDGNFALARALGAMSSAVDMFMGERPTRYLMVTRDCVVERLRLEASPVSLTCTRPEDVFL